MSGLNFLSADKFINRMFRKADNVVWDLMTGKIGVRTKDGITTLEGAGDDAQVTTNMFDQFGVSIPAFAQSTPLAAVAVGDMILQANDKPAWVIKRNEKPTTVKDPATGADTAGAPRITFGLMRSDGTTTTWTPPKVQMLGFESGVMVLRSLMTMLPGGASGLGQMQGMLLPMMMMGGLGGEDGDAGSTDLEKMIPMMLMMQMGTGAGADPNAGGMGQMMNMMMMMNMLKGGGNKLFDSSTFEPVKKGNSPFNRS